MRAAVSQGWNRPKIKPNNVIKKVDLSVFCLALAVLFTDFFFQTCVLFWIVWCVIPTRGASTTNVTLIFVIFFKNSPLLVTDRNETQGSPSPLFRNVTE